MNILRASDYMPVPWKNGGGVTRNVFVKWSDENCTIWDWRISMADVVQSGPFSHFVGIDRSIAVLEGCGLKLHLPQGQSVTLDQSTEPFVFAGEMAVMCETLDGPTTDLNVMTARKAFRHSLRKFYCTETTTITLATGWNALVANAAFELRSSGKHFALQCHDAAIDIGDKIEVSPIEPGDIFLLNVSAA